MYMEQDSLQNLSGIGPALSKQLREVGIDSADALREVGAQGAWLRILATDPSACMNRLLALRGAELGTGKAGISEDERAALGAFYREHK